MSEADVITIRRKAVCPGCGMTIEKGNEMYRSLKMPNKLVCITCAIKERKEIKAKHARVKADGLSRS